MSTSDLAPAEELPVETVSESPVFPAAAAPTWQDHDGVLREMWMQNKTPQDISAALGRSVPAIMTRAARLGLPRRSAPGRKPGRRSPDSPPKTIMSTPRAPSSVSNASQSAVQAAPQTSMRICLMCLNKFESQGRHNRICSSCKGSSEYGSAMALPELNIPM